MIKPIVVPLRGPIYPIRGGFYGPITNPLRIDASDIKTLLVKEYPVQEALPDGTFLELNFDNYDKPNNETPPPVDPPDPPDPPDTTPPVIQYSGQTSVTVEYGADYTAPTLTATDNKDATVNVVRTITVNGTTVGNIDTTIPGVYTITYTAKDKANNTATPVVITVTVKEEEIEEVVDP